MRKRVLDSDRVRQVPRQFGWIDRRVLREGYLGRCDAQALALYLVLVIVADAQGSSFYADATLERLLSMSADTLARARANLLRAGLIAYRAPLYQVLGNLDVLDNGGFIALFITAMRHRDAIENYNDGTIRPPDEEKIGA